MLHSWSHACYMFIEFSLIWLPPKIPRLTNNKLLVTHPTPAHVAPRLKKEYSYIYTPPLCLQGRLQGETLSSWCIFSSILFLSLFSPLIFTDRLICSIQFLRVGVRTRIASLPFSKLLHYGQTVEWRRWRHVNVRCAVHGGSLTFVNRTLRCVFKTNR
jgi:hypothetical protein